jgi:16S rRNA U516 pseudouridylate synthase RsuA-like enzyme
MCKNASAVHKRFLVQVSRKLDTSIVQPLKNGVTH